MDYLYSDGKAERMLFLVVLISHTALGVQVRPKWYLKIEHRNIFNPKSPFYSTGLWGWLSEGKESPCKWRSQDFITLHNLEERNAGSFTASGT